VDPLLTLMLHQEIVNGLYRHVQSKYITVEQAVSTLAKVQPSLDCAALILADVPDTDDDTEERLYSVIRAGKWASTHTNIMPAWTADAIIRSLPIHDRSDHAIAYELRKVLDKMKVER
jgi:hypothetical protein